MSEKKRSPKALHEPTSEQRAEVKALSQFGLPQDEIAAYIGIDPKTLRKHYRAELDIGAIQQSITVRKFIFEAASGRALEKGATYRDCLTAAMFWGKTKLGLRETTTTEVYQNQGPAPKQDELEAYTDEQLAEIIANGVADGSDGNDEEEES